VRRTRVEAGSNTSTVTLRVVGGDGKGSLKSETVKYGLKFQGTWTRERLRWQGPAAYTKDRPVLSSKWAPLKQDCNCQTVTNIWSWAPDGTWHQDLLTDSPSVVMRLKELNLVVRRWRVGNGVRAEDEEFPLLEAFTRKRLMKAVQAGEQWTVKCGA
jgi:hypothetical protein